MDTEHPAPGAGGQHAGTRRRARPLVAVLVVLAALAAACSDDPSSEQTVSLRVMMTDDWVTEPFLAAVRDFESSHPNVRVNVETTPISHMLDTVSAAVKSGNSPDVVQAHAFSAAAQSLAQQVDDLWAADKPLDTSEFLPGAMDDVTWAGRLYGVPLDTNALFLLYNAEHYSAAGMAGPKGRISFDQFEQAARALTTDDGNRRALAMPTSTWWTYGWIRAAGGDLMRVGPDGKVQLTFDDPGAVAALGFLSRLVRDGLAHPPTAADSHSDDAFTLFREARASTLASGSWDLAAVRRLPGGSRFETALLPSGTAAGGGSVMGGSSLFVPTGSRHRDLAFEFMTHLVSDTYALRLAKEEGRLPVRPRLYEDPFFDRPELTAVIDQLPSASPMKLTAFPEAHQVFADAVDRVLRAGEDPATVMADAQRRAQALLPASP